VRKEAVVAYFMVLSWHCSHGAEENKRNLSLYGYSPTDILGFAAVKIWTVALWFVTCIVLQVVQDYTESQPRPHSSFHAIRDICRSEARVLVWMYRL
jgi:hypothetical protein